MDDDLFNSPGENDLSLFNDERPVLVDENKDWLTELVGEDKKFKSPAELAKGKAHSDAFIKKLQGELNTLRNELNKAKTVDDLFARLSERGNQNLEGNSSGTNQNHSGDSGSNSNVSLEDITKKIREELQREETLKKREANLNQAVNTLKEKFGDQAGAYLNTKANELGVSVNKLKEMAEESPALFYSAIALNASNTKASNPFVTPPAPKVNLGLQAVGGEERTWAWYQKLKAKDRAKYNSLEIQKQMTADAKRLGEAFFDT